MLQRIVERHLAAVGGWQLILKALGREAATQEINHWGDVPVRWAWKWPTLGVG